MPFWLARAGLHELAARSLRGRGYGLRALATPSSDVLLAVAWFAGLFREEIDRRGKRVIVGKGTVLSQRREPRDRPVDPAPLHAG